MREYAVRHVGGSGLSPIISWISSACPCYKSLRRKISFLLRTSRICQSNTQLNVWTLSRSGLMSPSPLTVRAVAFPNFRLCLNKSRPTRKQACVWHVDNDLQSHCKQLAVASSLPSALRTELISKQILAVSRLLQAEIANQDSRCYRSRGGIEVGPVPPAVVRTRGSCQVCLQLLEVFS